MSKEWTIYKITNPKGRVYVGKTSNMKQRMAAYRICHNKSQPLFHNSLISYGFDNHKVEVLESGIPTNEIADDKEMFWIRSYMANLNKWRDGNGMNLSDGGEGNIGAKYNRLIGPNRGKKYSEVERQQKREYIFFKRKEGGHNDRSISQYNINGELISSFTSIMNAYRALNILPQNISRSLKDQRKTTGGFHFKYK